MTEIKKILLALRDPDAASEPALGKAIQLAHRLGAELELFHCLYDPRILRLQAVRARDAAGAIELLVQRVRAQLERHAKLPRDQGLRVRTSVHWDRPPYEGIIRQALRHKVDLVVASSHPYRRLERLLLDLTDWQLIRLCPLPLLLVKSPRPWKQPTVLAAVDPLHTHAKTALLDEIILDTGRTLATTLGGELHALHVHGPALTVVPGPMAEPVLVPGSPRETRQYAQRLRRLVSALGRRHGISPRRLHIVTGEPTQLLPKVAGRAHAQLVVMGAVSRSDLRRLFIGDTAQRVIDALECDVCVVKTPKFRTPVPRSGAAAEREA